MISIASGVSLRRTGRKARSPATGAAPVSACTTKVSSSNFSTPPTTCATIAVACKRGGGYMGHVDLILQFDGEKLLGWQGGSAYLQLISNSGARVNLNYVGSLMGVDNIEAPVNRSGIFQAWLQQSFLDDKGSLRLGLYPIDSEFYVTDSSGVFLHPSFGMSAEAGDFGTLAGPRSTRPAPGAPACGSIPTLPGTRCWPSPAACRASVQRLPAPTSAGNRAAAACSSVKSACVRPSWA
jgi:hypothetical protein